ncbi:MAG: SMP-30/gluconolactonase/LRE family protein [Crocinitomicaceae bacterium]
MKILNILILQLLTIPLFAQTVETFVTDSIREFESIFWHEDGRIISVDYNNGRVYRIDANGAVQTVVTGFTHLAGGGFDKNDDFYFSAISDGEVYRLNDNNSTDLIASGLSQPTGIIPTSDPDVLYVAEYGDHSVSKVTISTGNVQSWITGGATSINGPDGMVYKDSSSFLIANFNNTKIHEVDTSGTFDLFTDLPATGYMGYIEAANGEFYVTAFSSRKVFRVDDTGNAELIAGTGASGSQDGAALNATFTTPNGIAVNATGDSMLVTDANKIRLITGFSSSASVSEEESFKNLMLAPNPVNDVLSVSFDAKNSENFNWEIISLKGEVILRDTMSTQSGINNLKVSVESLPSGGYLFRLFHKTESVQYSFIRN